MLKSARAQTALPAQDLDRAKAFYRDKLGLQPLEEDAGNVRYRVGDGTEFNVFRTMGAPSGTHTQMAFIVEDIVGEVKDLKSRGVTFEEYDYPELKTKDGIAEGGGAKVAWFKDSEGNLLNIVQPARVPAGRTT
ncbi:MAG: VOC family protein [Chloroflexi bacterium]|nr:MAG: VOC family protein [Chloroflexota bacterium]